MRLGYSVKGDELRAAGDGKASRAETFLALPSPTDPSQNSKAGPVAVTRFNHEFRSPGKSVVTRQVEFEVRLRMGEVHSQTQACHPHRSRKEQGQELGLIQSSQTKRTRLPSRHLTALAAV